MESEVPVTSYLFAAVVLVGIIGLLNLLLTFGVIRRLKEHDVAIAARPHGGPDGELMLPVGAPVGAFSTATVDGATVTQEVFADLSVVGFFSTDCAPCQERLPQFVDYAAAFPGGRERVLVVVIAEPAPDAPAADAEPPKVDRFVAQASAVARVVVEPHGGPVATAMSVQGFPVMAVIDGGTLVASGSTLNDIPVPSRA